MSFVIPVCRTDTVFHQRLCFLKSTTDTWIISLPDQKQQLSPDKNRHLHQIKKQCYIDGCNYIEMSLDLNPQAYKNTGWAFLVTCELDDDIEKKDVSVLFYGVGYHIVPCFELLTNNDMNWNFEVINLNEDVPDTADPKFLCR